VAAGACLPERLLPRQNTTSGWPRYTLACSTSDTPEVGGNEYRSLASTLNLAVATPNIQDPDNSDQFRCIHCLYIALTSIVYTVMHLYGIAVSQHSGQVTQRTCQGP